MNTDLATALEDLVRIMQRVTQLLDSAPTCEIATLTDATEAGATDAQQDTLQ